MPDARVQGGACRLHRINFFEYLSDVLNRVAEMPNGARMGQVLWSSTFLRWEIAFPGGSTEPLNRYESKDITVKD